MAASKWAYHSSKFIEWAPHHTAPMFDTPDQLKAQLLAGEDSRSEFKELRLTARGV